MGHDKEYSQSFNAWQELTSHQIEALKTDIKNIEKEVKLKKEMLRLLEIELETSKEVE